MTVEAFIALSEDAKIDAKIAEKEQELEAARRAAQLQQRAGLTAVTVPVFPAAFAQLLAKTFADISTDAERRVAEHVARHQMQARGETWLAEGLRYIAGEECPFCGQGLTGIDLIQAYRSFFSREYHALRDEVTGLSGQVESAVGDRVVAAIDQTVLQNDNSLEFWRQYCEIVPLAFPETGNTGK
jgi:wobble nucleotide-excising tRNase